MRVNIDGLPLTREGFERAKRILTSTYGKPSEIINAYIQNIIALPYIKGNNPSKIYDFYCKLLTRVQALESMGKLKEITDLTRVSLDKLEGIRADLVRTDNWEFPELTDALKGWTERNPVTLEEKSFSLGNPNVRGHGARQSDYPQASHMKKDKTFKVKQQELKCTSAYCDSNDHKSNQCNNIREVSERKSILREKKLCYNCAGSYLRAVECNIRSGCQVCHRRHHTSICED